MEDKSIAFLPGKNTRFLLKTSNSGDSDEENTELQKQLVSFTYLKLILTLA
jgi:hypothetical protein